MLKVSFYLLKVAVCTPDVVVMSERRDVCALRHVHDCYRIHSIFPNLNERVSCMRHEEPFVKISINPVKTRIVVKRAIENVVMVLRGKAHITRGATSKCLDATSIHLGALAVSLDAKLFSLT
jgi:hypothetical protein